MIATLRGKVLGNTESALIVEVGGIGYSVTTVPSVRLGEEVGRRTFSPYCNGRARGFMDALWIPERERARSLSTFTDCFGYWSKSFPRNFEFPHSFGDSSSNHAGRKQDARASFRV